MFSAAPGKQYPLRPKEFATKTDPAAQANQVVLQTLQPEDINVFPGMTAAVAIFTPEQVTEKKPIFIPPIAVGTEPDRK